MHTALGWVRVAFAMFAVGWGANQFSTMLIVYGHALGLSPAAIAGLFAVYGATLIRRCLSAARPPTGTAAVRSCCRPSRYPRWARRWRTLSGAVGHSPRKSGVVGHSPITSVARERAWWRGGSTGQLRHSPIRSIAPGEDPVARRSTGTATLLTGRMWVQAAHVRAASRPSSSRTDAAVSRAHADSPSGG